VDQGVRTLRLPPSPVWSSSVFFRLSPPPRNFALSSIRAGEHRCGRFFLFISAMGRHFSPRFLRVKTPIGLLSLCDALHRCVLNIRAKLTLIHLSNRVLIGSSAAQMFPFFCCQAIKPSPPFTNLSTPSLRVCPDMPCFFSL